MILCYPPRTPYVGQVLQAKNAQQINSTQLTFRPQLQSWQNSVSQIQGIGDSWNNQNVTINTTTIIIPKSKSSEASQNHNWFKTPDLPMRINFDAGSEGHSNIVYRTSWFLLSSWSISSKTRTLKTRWTLILNYDRITLRRGGGQLFPVFFIRFLDNMSGKLKKFATHTYIGDPLLVNFFSKNFWASLFVSLSQPVNSSAILE